jgi:hypothetical protein
MIYRLPTNITFQSKVLPQSGKRALGLVMTLSASAVYALILSLFELTFEKVIRARTLRWVLTLQICTNAGASAVPVAALFASGEWRKIPGEATAFEHGTASYAATLEGIAVGWEAATLGAVRLIARVSSLFANVTGTLALPLVPVFAVAMFGDRMTGVKPSRCWRCSWRCGGSSLTSTSTTSMIVARLSE